MHVHLSKDICHLITRFQLQTKSHVFSFVLKAPEIFLCQCYFAINFVKYEEKKGAEQKQKKIYATELSQGFSIMRAEEFYHYRNEGLRWGCICHGKERKHGRTGKGVGIDMLPWEAWEFWTGWLQKIPLLWLAGFFSNYPSHFLLS